MIRVCYVVPSMSAAGTERQLLYLIRGMVRDHEVTVLCTHHEGALAGDARRLGAFIRPLNLMGGWDPRLYRRLRRVFRRHRPDILHTFLFGFDYGANRAARDTGVPVTISSRRQLATWKRPRHIRLQQRANRLVDCIVANSQAVARFAADQENEDPSRYRVIPNGCDLEWFSRAAAPRDARQRFRLPPDAPLVGMVANFSEVKDHGLFLRAAAETLKRRGDVHFVLCGSGPLREAVMRQAKALGIARNVHRIATLDEIRDVYAMLDVQVLCSKAEGFPNALLEGMAMGAPVVAAKVGGVPELVEDGVTGRLVDSREPSAWAQAIEAALGEPERTRAMADAARERVRTRYSTDAMVAAYRALYRELLVKTSRKGA
jgi:glycosyltransferase involved in cell wall biosynthesis